MENLVKLPLNITRTNYTVVASRSHLTSETTDFIEDLKRTHGEIELISKGSSLKLCLVAEGTADCYPRFSPTMEWDIAAGHAICKYAGVEVIDNSTKKEMRYNRKKLRNNWFVVKRT
jgi:3'(2'), 5'-bisphosphate nucleotidase